jgi:hypothetical protein
MERSLVEQYVQHPDHLRMFQQERAIYEVTELMESVMEEQGISRADLAKRLGRSKGWVTQLLDGQANKTVRTVADVFAVMGREFRSFAPAIRINNCFSVHGRLSGNDVHWGQTYPTPHLKVRMANG